MKNPAQAYLCPSGKGPGNITLLQSLATQPHLTLTLVTIETSHPHGSLGAASLYPCLSVYQQALILKGPRQA